MRSRLLVRLCRDAPSGKRASVPIRDETGKFIGVRQQTAAEMRQVCRRCQKRSWSCHCHICGAKYLMHIQALAAQKAGGTGGIFKSAAVQVLRQEKRLMSTGAPGSSLKLNY